MKAASSDHVCLELRQVAKTYVIETQQVKALQGVDLLLHKREVAALIGRSGAGKSTLLHLCGTLDRPTSGQVIIHGRPTQTMTDSEVSRFRNLGIGFIFQMNNLLPEFSALENVFLPGLIAGHTLGACKERGAKVLHAVGLSHREAHRPGELSGGEQQRVAIARALFLAPPLILADEPTGNLDIKTSHGIQDLLLNLCHELGLTMLLVTHDLELANRLPRRIVMEDGKLIQ